MKAGEISHGAGWSRDVEHLGTVFAHGVEGERSHDFVAELVRVKILPVLSDMKYWRMFFRTLLGNWLV